MGTEQHNFSSLSSHNSPKTINFPELMPKINIKQLKSVTASGTPYAGPSDNKLTTKTAPLTIFYNGEMVVFPLPPQEAHNIIDLCTKTEVAAAADSKLLALSSSILALKRGDDIPIARKKSLHQFLEKRKQRLAVVSPAPDSCFT